MNRELPLITFILGVVLGTMLVLAAIDDRDEFTIPFTDKTFIKKVEPKQEHGKD